MFERLLVGSSSSLGSSSQPSLSAVGRSISNGAEAPAGAAAAAAPAPAASGAAPFTFDFFEKARCVSGEVKLSGDLSQTGVLCALLVTQRDAQRAVQGEHSMHSTWRRQHTASTSCLP